MAGDRGIFYHFPKTAGGMATPWLIPELSCANLRKLAQEEIILGKGN